MNGGFREGLLELADEVARVHDAGTGLPAAEIGALSRRARRRHEARLAVLATAVVAVLVVGAAALVDRGGSAPPADDPLSVDDAERLTIDPLSLGAVVDDLGALVPFDRGMVWGMPEAVVTPDDGCRQAMTVSSVPPRHDVIHLWRSEGERVLQEVLLFDDAAQAAAEFEALRGVLAGCPEFGYIEPSSYGNSGGGREVNVIADLADGTLPLPSLRLVGTQRGLGVAAGWVRVDVLVSNAIVQLEVMQLRSAVGVAPAPDQARVLDELVQELLGEP